MRAQTENAKSRLQNGGTVFYSGVIQRRTAEEGREQRKFDFVATAICFRFTEEGRHSSAAVLTVDSKQMVAQRTFISPNAHHNINA